MRKIKEILRLKHENGLSVRKIGICCNLNSSTVSDYLARAKIAGISWPIPDGMWGVMGCHGDGVIDKRLQFKVT